MLFTIYILVFHCHTPTDVLSATEHVPAILMKLFYLVWDTLLEMDGLMNIAVLKEVKLKNSVSKVLLNVNNKPTNYLKKLSDLIAFKLNRVESTVMSEPCAFWVKMSSFGSYEVIKQLVHRAGSINYSYLCWSLHLLQDLLEIYIFFVT